MNLKLKEIERIFKENKMIMKSNQKKHYSN